MDYRSGKCSQCGAEYKIPASFAHNVARCKVCQGVVHLGPVQGGKGPRSERAETGAASARPGPRPLPPRPAQASAAENQPAPRAEAAGAPPARPTSAAGEPAAPRAPAATPESRTALPRTPERRVAAALDSSVRGPAERATPAQKSSAPIGLVVGAGVVLALVLLFFFKDAVFGHAKSTDGPAHPTPNASPAESAPATGALLQPADAPADAAAPRTAATQTVPDARELAARPDFAPTADTTHDEWLKLEERVAQWLDEDARPDVAREAHDQLLQQKRKAVPAILNGFKRLDLTSERGRSSAQECQRALTQICNGSTPAAVQPGATSPAALAGWLDSWKHVDGDVEGWIQLAHLDEKDPAEAARLRALSSGATAGDGTGGR